MRFLIYWAHSEGEDITCDLVTVEMWEQHGTLLGKSKYGNMAL